MRLLVASEGWRTPKSEGEGRTRSLKPGNLPLFVLGTRLLSLDRGTFGSISGVVESFQLG